MLIVKFPLDHWRQSMITDGRMNDGLNRGHDVFTPGPPNEPPLRPQIACMSTPEYERGGGEGEICQSQSKPCISTCRGTLGASGLYGSHTPLSRYTSASQRRSSDGGRRPSMYVRLGCIVWPPMRLAPTIAPGLVWNDSFWAYQYSTIAPFPLPHIPFRYTFRFSPSKFPDTTLRNSGSKRL